MNCTEARSALALGSARAGDLARHLLDCPRCAAAARIDDCVDDARAWLVSEAPPRLDVRARVLARIERLEPGARDEIRAWHLALVHAAAVLAVVAMVALAWPGWSSAAQGLAGLLQVLTLLVSALGSVALAGFRAALGVLALARGWPESMADWAARLAPGVRVGIGLSYVAMFLAVLRVLERDLRGDARARTEEWRS